MDKNECMNANIKLVLSPGIGKTDLEIGKDETLLLYAQKYIDYPKMHYTKGIKLMSVDFKRNLSEVKSSDYIQAVCLRNKFKKQKAFEMLYILNGYVTECSTSNIFMIKKGVLITPKKDVLFGVTRNFIVNFARKAMKVVEKDVKIKDLLKADEVFITATSKEIMPVVKIDNHVINDGKVGKNTIMLQDLFVKNRDKYLGVD
jgi:branched-chain amino acid aminotransferase